MKWFGYCLGAIVLVVGMIFHECGHAAEPRWSGVVIAQGAYFQHLQAKPIHHRPYRPFHFIGNTIRRQYYRGTPLPAPRDLSDGLDALAGQPPRPTQSAR